MNLMDRITIDPAICHGKPILRGDIIRSKLFLNF